jgi:hypothetical protein
MSEDKPQWDAALAERLEGAKVVIGITYNEAAGPRLEQVFGTILSADENEGVAIRLEGMKHGELFRLPPDLRAFFPAAPGSYRLKGTGEVVVDPDYTAVWEVNPRKQ